ncbi:MAG: hypothetical protein PVF19_00500, partial [Gemmatimonadota bacterium]
RGSRAAACSSRLVLPLALAGGLLVTACQGPVALSLPSVDELEENYASVAAGLEEAEVNGNVAVIVVRQSSDQLRRGGTIWARVGPYIYLFSEETRKLFEDYDGLAGVRVITRTSSGSTVANALLTRDELTSVLWRRSLNISGRARRDGTDRVTLLEDLIEWGEDHTEFEYNPRYVPR